MPNLTMVVHMIEGNYAMSLKNVLQLNAGVLLMMRYTLQMLAVTEIHCRCLQQHHRGVCFPMISTAALTCHHRQWVVRNRSDVADRV